MYKEIGNSIVIPLCVSFVSLFFGSVVASFGADIPGFILSYGTDSIIIFLASFVSGAAFWQVCRGGSNVRKQFKENKRLVSENANLRAECAQQVSENANLREECAQQKALIEELNKTKSFPFDIDLILCRENKGSQTS